MDWSRKKRTTHQVSSLNIHITISILPVLHFEYFLSIFMDYHFEMRFIQMLQVLQICELFSQKHLNFTFDLVTPVPCLNHCHCYHPQDFRVNVYDCSQGRGFPMNRPNNTDWLFCSNSHISSFPDDIPFIKNITNLNISNNSIQNFPEKFLTALAKFRKLKTLDISKNNLSIIPKQFQHLVK